MINIVIYVCVIVYLFVYINCELNFVLKLVEIIRGFIIGWCCLEICRKV